MTDDERIENYLTMARERFATYRPATVMSRHVFDEAFGPGAKIGSKLRIKLPSDAYRVVSIPPMPLPAPLVGAPEVAAMGIAAVLAKNPVVSRRFWAR